MLELEHAYPNILCVFAGYRDAVAAVARWFECHIRLMNDHANDRVWKRAVNFLND